MVKPPKATIYGGAECRGVNLGSSSLKVVVVVVVYSTTNQRHVGYLSSGNGHLAGRYSTP